LPVWLAHKSALHHLHAIGSFVGDHHHRGAHVGKRRPFIHGDGHNSGVHMRNAVVCCCDALLGVSVAAHHPNEQTVGALHIDVNVQLNCHRYIRRVKRRAK